MRFCQLWPFLVLIASSYHNAWGFQTRLSPSRRVPVSTWSEAPCLSTCYRSHDNGLRTSSAVTLSLKASTTADLADDSKADAAKPSLPVVLWRFSRPHTVIGSALAIPALHILAAPTFRQAFSASAAIATVFAMIPALLMNLYITGLNQVYDVEIDRINKPDLPLASGDLSMRGGVIAVVVSLILSLALGVSHPVLGSQGLNVALWFSGILGTMYSVPPIRLKRFPFFAAFCIIAVRGAVINAGFFAHAKAAAYGAASASVLKYLLTDARCMLSSLYFAVFGMVIALMKDVPDATGDRIFNIRTFSVRWGQRQVFQMMHRLLSFLFWGVGASFAKEALWGTATTGIRVCRGLVALAAIAAGASVQKEAAPVNPEDSDEVYSFYMHLWKLFYLSYLVLPLAR